MTEEQKSQAQNKIKEALKEYKSSLILIKDGMHKAGKEFITGLEKIHKEK